MAVESFDTRKLLKSTDFLQGISEKSLRALAAIGTIPETFSRLLLPLKQEQTIQWEGEILRLVKGFWKQRSLDAI
jgi:hypothetical protein